MKNEAESGFLFHIYEPPGAIADDFVGAPSGRGTS